ncbi:similar to Saccharomyces cerevisiae YNL138W-A YSF3 Component of the SF3b subcomplex of the U2 snRNP (Partial), partial [Geotrichum candidum]
MADRLRDQQKFEHLQNRYIGVGTPDTTRYEWQTNVHRDTYTSFVGHPALLEYLSIGLGEPQAVVKTQFIDKMIQPCGPPPSKD